MACMILASLRSRPEGTVKLLYRQITLRHASKSSRAGGSSKKSTSSIKKADRASSIPSTSSTAASNSSSSSSSAANAGEEYVKEKVVYQIGADQNVADARLLLGFGLMFCIFCINGADIVRREPKQPTDPDAPRMESWPAWKRWGGAAGFAAIGLGIGAYCVYWPTRILKKMTLISPSGNAIIPTKRLQSGGRYTTPYQACQVRFTTGASEVLPKIFKAPVVPFTQLRLLGPLSSQQKWYHPKDSAAFGEKAMKGGKMPSNVPLGIEGTKIIYNVRKAGGIFSDLDGFERALLANDPATRIEVPRTAAQAQA